MTYIEGNYENNDLIDADNFHQILKLELKEKSKQKVLEAIRSLEKIDGILSAEPNYNFNFAATSDNSPTNTLSATNNESQQWGLYGDKGIDVEYAWEMTKGNSEIRVAVLDSGIAAHPDLNNKVVTGWDFENNDSVTNDDTEAHGTLVAGVISSIANVQLVPLQIKDDSDFCTIASAINWATNNNIDIINCSGGDINANVSCLKNAIANFQGLFVCAAGNGIRNDRNGKNNDNIGEYPSNYSYGQSFSNRVISVGAISSNGNLASLSNYGLQSVSIFAPGINIRTTCPTNLISSGYLNKDGTSLAAPFVTGTAALLYSLYYDINHNMSKAELAGKVKTAIMNSVVIDAGSPSVGYCASGGRLNAVDALSYVAFNTSNISENKIRIDGAKCEMRVNSMLSIPSKIKGRTVTDIANAAFINKKIYSIRIPSSVTYIGANAFQGCTNLSTVEFQTDSQLEVIGNAAFYGSGLSSISIPSGVKQIGPNTFEKCTKLIIVEFLPDSQLTRIDNGAFYDCEILITLTLPASVTSIGANAFENIFLISNMEVI